MMIMRQNNGMTDYTSVIYIERETELSRPIQQGAVYDVKQT